MASNIEGVAGLRSSENYNKMMRASFRKMYKELAVTMDVLSKYFDIADSKSYINYFDYVNPVNATRKDNALEVLADTRGAVLPDYRRRQNNIESSVIHIASPRAHAKVTGRTIAEQVAMDTSLARDAMAREHTKMILDLLLGTYYDNPLIRERSGGKETITLTGASVEKPFSKEFIHLCKEDARYGRDANDTAYKTSPNKFRAPPVAEAFFDLTAEMNDYKKLTMNDPSMNKGTGSGTSSRLMAIVSNKGFAAWKKANKQFIAHREWFGKSIILGTGKIMSFQEFDFLVLPDEFMGIPTAANDSRFYGIGNFDDVNATKANAASFKAQVTFPDPVNWDKLDTNLLNAVQSSDNHNAIGGFANSKGLHTMVIVDPMAFKMFRPTQFEVKMRTYESQSTSFEKFSYGEAALEGVRKWDGLVRVVKFTGAERTGDFE